MFVPAALVLPTPVELRLALGSLFTVVFAIDAAIPYLRSQSDLETSEFRYGGGLANRLRLVVDVAAALPFLFVGAPYALHLLWLLKLYRVVRLFRVWRMLELRRLALLRLAVFAYGSLASLAAQHPDSARGLAAEFQRPEARTIACCWSQRSHAACRL